MQTSDKSHFASSHAEERMREAYAQAAGLQGARELRETSLAEKPVNAECGSCAASCAEKLEKSHEVHTAHGVHEACGSHEDATTIQTHVLSEAFGAGIPHSGGMLHDAHIHLNACANADELAEYAANQGIYVACVTRNAEEFHTARACFACYSGIDVGLGLHPWDITSKAAAEKLLAHFQSTLDASVIQHDAALHDGSPHTSPYNATQNAIQHNLTENATQHDSASCITPHNSSDYQRKQSMTLPQSSAPHNASTPRASTHVSPVQLIGEIGLDYAPAHREMRTLQQQVFSQVIKASCTYAQAINTRITLSMHAVKSCGDVLDILEHYQAFQHCACVFHWFSGSCDDLHRAVRNGAYFSVGTRMLQSKRTAEYLKLIPCASRLIETDFPHRDTTIPPDEWRKTLETLAAALYE